MKFNKGSDGLCILLHNICIKIPTSYKEVEIQKIASELEISPKIFFYGFGICIMERIYGKTLDKCSQNELDLCKEYSSAFVFPVAFPIKKPNKIIKIITIPISQCKIFAIRL